MCRRCFFSGVRSSIGRELEEEDDDDEAGPFFSGVRSSIGRELEEEDDDDEAGPADMAMRLGFEGLGVGTVVSEKAYAAIRCARKCRASAPTEHGRAQVLLQYCNTPTRRALAGHIAIAEHSSRSSSSSHGIISSSHGIMFGQKNQMAEKA